MRAQLARLAEAAELSQVTTQLLLFSAGEHAALEGSFMILGFAGAGEHAVVYLDATTGGIYVDKAEDVARVRPPHSTTSAPQRPAPKDSIQFITGHSQDHELTHPREGDTISGNPPKRRSSQAMGKPI